MIITNNTPRQILQKAWRHSTSKWRPLPDFFLGGVAKGGTETLWFELLKHPQITKAISGNIHYFDEANFKSLNWYRSHFPFTSHQHNKIIGDKSTFYLSHPFAPELIAQKMRTAKLIFMLRNPTERAISQYFHFKQRGYEDLDLLDAIKAEERRLKPHLNEININSNFPPGHPLKIYSYKWRGHYAENLKQFFKFIDRKQILIIKSEDFFTNSTKILKEIFTFLELDIISTDKIQIKNKGVRPIDVSKSVYNYLDDYFEPFNEELKILLGDKFIWKHKKDSD